MEPLLFRVPAQGKLTVLTLENEAFREKLLCDGITLNLGDACGFGCTYCYVPAAIRKVAHSIISLASKHFGRELRHADLVIRRKNAVELLARQLKNFRGVPKFLAPNDRRVVYGSTLVDVAANVALLKELAEALELIFSLTNWQVRLLSKSSLLRKLIEDRMIAEKYHRRIIFGFSTGTLDDRVARSIEIGTAAVSKRLEALHWVQDRGLRTYGMICPSLPQDDYTRFSKEICEAVRVDRCEHVWAEVINLRGDSFVRTLAALDRAGLRHEAALLSSVCGKNSKSAWEAYARETFLAHTAHVPPEKLRFLQYVTKDSAPWWAARREAGAVLLGKAAAQPA